MNGETRTEKGGPKRWIYTASHVEEGARLALGIRCDTGAAAAADGKEGLEQPCGVIDR